MNKDERHIRILSVLNSFKAGQERDKIQAVMPWSITTFPP